MHASVTASPGDLRRKPDREGVVVSGRLAAKELLISRAFF
jgi:hypothetical protein